MSQCCGKIPDENDVKHIRSSMAHGNKLQGDIGEQVAAEAVTNQLNLSAEFFDPPHNGFDGVFRDGSGKLVIMEAKMTDTGGMGALHGTNFGKQTSVEWVRHTAELMCDPLSSQYSPDNAKIGQEILDVGPENVHLVYVHTNPTTLKSTVRQIR